MIRLSRRVRSVAPSATLATAARVRALRAAGVEVVSLALGEPDFESPSGAVEACVRALESGATKYPPLAGLPALREAIVRRLEEDQGLTYGPEEVLVTVGAKQAVYDACQAFLEEGDEALIPAPYWVSYPDMVHLAGAVPVRVPCDPAHGFVPQPEALAARIGARTRLLFLNSPSNPTGATYRREDLEALAGVLRRHPQIVVVSDDIYERIRYDGRPFANLVMAAPDLRDRTVLVNGFSKAYAMTGWRLGWSAAPPDLTAAMARVQGQSTSGATLFAQHGALAALEGDQAGVERMVAEFQRRRDHLVGRLQGVPGLVCERPGGAFYAFTDVRALLGRRHRDAVIRDDAHLADLLLERQGLAVVAGAAFGGPGFLRLSFSTSVENLDRGVDRLAAFVSELT